MATVNPFAQFLQGGQAGLSPNVTPGPNPGSTPPPTVTNVAGDRGGRPSSTAWQPAPAPGSEPSPAQGQSPTPSPASGPAVPNLFGGPTTFVPATGAGPVSSPSVPAPVAPSTPAPAGAQAAQPGVQAQPGVAQGVSPAAVQPMRMNRMLEEWEVDMLPAGSVVETPTGLVKKDEQGNSIVELNPEGQALYQQRVMELRRKFTTPLQGIPGVPEPILEVGRSNFNPFTGQWVS